ncbi:hypothetical protein ACSBR1_043019 [Camellia fascicularis]
MATNQRASRSPLLLLLISLLIGAAAALASRRRWPFQLRFSSHRCCLFPIWSTRLYIICFMKILVMPAILLWVVYLIKSENSGNPLSYHL